jgi:hypothetical protein
MSVGILAFGSIVDSPEAEIATAVVRRIDVETPFPVEFARSSRTRDRAPTLVPVRDGGARVPATVLILDDSIVEDDARAMLYQRETGRSASRKTVLGADWIGVLTGFEATSTCLYTALPANIEPLTAGRLADLAVHSAIGPSGAVHRDGISYLLQQKRRNVTTPLLTPYEEAVLARVGALDLADAWKRIRSDYSSGS